MDLLCFLEVLFLLGLFRLVTLNEKPVDMTESINLDFALERFKSLTPDSVNEEFLLEISWLYNRVVKSGSAEPVIDLAYELVMPKDFVGECVRNAMVLGLIKTPKKGSNGGLISQKALRKLKLIGKQSV